MPSNYQPCKNKNGQLLCYDEIRRFRDPRSVINNLTLCSKLAKVGSTTVALKTFIDTFRDNEYLVHGYRYVV